MPNKNDRNTENKGLPARWRKKGNSFYYRVPPGQKPSWDNKTEFLLGHSLAEAYRTWSQRLDQFSHVKNIGQLLDRYALEVIPQKAPATQKGNIRQIVKISAVFGHMSILSITPQMAYQYIDKRNAKTEGKRELALLSHALTKAIEWGYLNTHPLKGQVVLKGSTPRDRFIEDWEVEAALTQANKMIACYIPIKILTGLRKSDLLNIKMSDLKDDGIHVMPRKTQNTTKKKLIITWSALLREAIDQAIKQRPKISPYLFCTRQADPYFDQETGSTSGFDSVWQRFMRKVIDNTAVKERFTEHDLRAKAVDDIELEHAQKLLAHSDPAITQRIYRRKPTKVAPSK